MAGTITSIHSCEGPIYLSREFAPRIAPFLQELVGGGAIEVLPALRSFSWSGSTHQQPAVQEAIETFLAARQLLGHPIAIFLLGQETGPVAGSLMIDQGSPLFYRP